MATLNTGFPAQGHYTEYANSIRRQKAQPTDYYEVFYSLSDAETYAKEDGTAYVGQKIVVVQKSGTKVAVTQYLIGDEDGNLIELCTTNNSYIIDGGDAQDAIDESTNS